MGCIPAGTRDSAPHDPPGRRIAQFDARGMVLAAAGIHPVADRIVAASRSLGPDRCDRDSEIAYGAGFR